MQENPYTNEVLRASENYEKSRNVGDAQILMVACQKFVAFNTLALGKPEPLAKNKQTENKPKCICDELIRSNSSGWCPACKTDWV